MDELLENAPCGFLSFTDDGKIKEANATLLALLGCSRAEISGRHVEKILSVAGRIFYQTHFFPLLKLNNRVDEIYLDLRSAAGRNIPVLVNAARHMRGGVHYNDCVFVPIQQRNEYEEEILRAKKQAEAATVAKDEFLSVVSHELRTPLNAILGWARLLQNDRLDAESRRHAIDTILRNAQIQTQLIEDILDFGRIVSGKLRLEMRRLDPAEVVKSAVESVTPAAAAKNIRIETIVERAASITGDAGRLQQVVWNLLSNAVKFTVKGGRVDIRLTRADANVEISVRDTGQGIAPDFLPFIFERFKQQDASTTRRFGGLGLGMAISRHIVEMHGGTIGAESPGEDQGATFTVRLPLIVSPERKTEEKPIPRAATPVADELALDDAVELREFHALVVDDDRDARELIDFVLTKHGARVSIASSVAEALEKFRAARPNLVISDIEMPDEDGFALIEKLRILGGGRESEIPFIALTGRARPADRLKILSAGYQVHLAKPVEPAELLAVIVKFAKRRERK